MELEGRVVVITGGAGGIGLSGQMHGSVFLDKKHEVIRPALLWNDQRTAVECDEITKAALVTHDGAVVLGRPA